MGLFATVGRVLGAFCITQHINVLSPPHLCDSRLQVMQALLACLQVRLQCVAGQQLVLTRHQTTNNSLEQGNAAKWFVSSP